MARVSINPDVLLWALRDSERTADDLESVTQRPRQEVNEWLAGTQAPNSGDLRKVAVLLGRSPYFFALPKPPAGRTYSGHFRTAIGQHITLDERASEVDALRWAQRQQNLAKAYVSSDDFEVPFDTTRDVAEVAADARSWLHWDTSLQTSATSKSAAFKRLRASVEHLQIAVMVTSAKTNRFCGFSLPDPQLPLIYINKDYELGSVRSFTLMHELAHVLHAERRVCYGGDSGVERWCNRFAAAFLMPASDVSNYFQKMKLHFTSAADTEPVRRVANRFRTSWLASAIRLEELGLSPPDVVKHIKESKPETAEKGFNPDGGKRTPEIRVDEYGGTFVRVISSALDSGKLASLDARRILRVDGKQLSEARAIAESDFG